MKHVLDNPVYRALLSGDKLLCYGNENVKFFNEEVSPFAGFDEDYKKGFDDLFELLPAGRNILYATPRFIQEPKGWTLLHEVKGLQFVFATTIQTPLPGFTPVPLQEEHVAQMMQLAALTRPGPFGSRTIDFGHYFGIFENGQLAAMTGQRLHAERYSEISAVCTHPDYLGKGYATALVHHQANLILQQDRLPFLHVREDNVRAVSLYQRLGFSVRGPMNFYFMRRQ